MRGKRQTQRFRFVSASERGGDEVLVWKNVRVAGRCLNARLTVICPVSHEADSVEQLLPGPDELDSAQRANRKAKKPRGFEVLKRQLEQPG